MLKAYHQITGMPISNLYTTGYLRSDEYAGTNLSHVPKIFIETGNMANAQDMQKLSTAFQTLYSSLSDEQKKNADEVFRARAAQHATTKH